MISKAPHILLEAFQRLPPGTATLDVVGAHADYHGDSSYRNVLGPLLSTPGVRVHGAQPRDRVADLLASLHLLVVPSIWPEPSPLVIREALLTGVPVIGSNIGGIPEIVEHERNGLLFEPGDVDGLYEALNRLCEEEGLLDRLRSGAAETPIRSLADDVGATRRLYEAHLCSVRLQADRRQVRLKPDTTPVVSVVLNYRTPADTSIAVASLKASERVPEVIVVDNDSGVACRDALARWNGAVTHLQTGSNLGFSGGMNAGIRQALAVGAQLCAAREQRPRRAAGLFGPPGGCAERAIRRRDRRSGRQIARVSRARGICRYRLQPADRPYAQPRGGGPRTCRHDGWRCGSGQRLRHARRP